MRLHDLATLPKILAVTTGNTLLAMATGAYDLAATAVHPMQVVVWICTAIGALAAGALAAVRAFVELRRYLTNRRRAARYRALKAAGKIPLP